MKRHLQDQGMVESERCVAESERCEVEKALDWAQKRLWPWPGEPASRKDAEPVSEDSSLKP